ncbi:MAG: TIGR01459 family HAD-type hydrolase [Labilithrix sp.]
MTRPVRLRDLANEFDTFFLDVWGVLHTGEGPLPGVLDTLRAARDAGTRIVLLTNTSRLGPQVVETLGKIGITRDLFTDVVTAGDVTRDAIVARDPAIFRDLPASPAAFHFGARDYVPWLFELGLDLDATPEDAQLVFATGAVSNEQALDRARETLRPAARRRVPLVCTNPDRVIPTSSGPKLGPGAVAAAYAAEGGPIFLYGKPHPPIYAEAQRRAGDARVVAMGDLVDTDVAGARAAGLAAALIGAVPEDATITPDFVLSAFAW